MAAGTLCRLFLIFLGLSHLICLKAAPITRSERLMQVPQVHLDALENAEKITTEENLQLQEEPSMRKRMDLELHDYPSSGANGRHTPRGPP